MDDQGPPGAEQGQGLGQQGLKLDPSDAEQLQRRGGGIGQRAEDVEDRGRAQLLPHRGDVFHGPMQKRRETEADAQFLQARLDARDVGLDVDAQFGQDVGRSAAAGGGAVAVFGHGDPGGGGHQRGRGADVERGRAVAAGAAGVDTSVRRVRMGVMCCRKAVAAPAISATVSPLWCRAARNRAISSSSQRPSMMRPMTAATSSIGRFRPASTSFRLASIMGTFFRGRRWSFYRIAGKGVTS